MLQFFRKYQKGFFVIITFAIIVSFLFFGTYGAFVPTAAHREDRMLHRGMNGKPISQQQLYALSALLQSSLFDSQRQGKLPNLLNDGVIERDILFPGVGSVLAHSYFEEVQADLESRFQKIKEYQPYLGAESVWKRFSPRFLEKYHTLKTKSDPLNAESFSLLSQLLLEQLMFPPETLRQFLYMQQNQKGKTVDPLLTTTDLSLFGFKTVEDWLGPHFITLVAQWILNISQLAEEKGYAVSKAEVKRSLLSNIHHGYRQLTQEKQPALAPQEVENYYFAIQRQLGMDETTLLDAWKKVILFRQFMEGASESILIDPLPFSQFEQFTKESVKIDLYELPQSFQFPDFLSMLKGQIYLEAIAQDPLSLRKQLHFPASFAPLEEIEKRSLELIEERYQLEWTSVSKAALAQQLVAKEVQTWELKTQSWVILQAQFPQWISEQAITVEQKINTLQQLDSKSRLQIDLFARRKMVEEHPEQIVAALVDAPSQKKEIGLRKKGGSLPFAVGNAREELIALLQKAPLKQELPNEITKRLHFFTPDQEIYYHIDLIARTEKQLVSFEEAMKDGTLDQLLNEQLEKGYTLAKKTSPRLFQKENGEFKPYYEVKQEIGQLIFADLLETIRKEYQYHQGALPVAEENLPLNFYSNARFISLMDAQKQCKQRGEELQDGPWQLTRSEKVVERSSPFAFPKEEMFSLPTGEWSKVEMAQKGQIAFYQVLDHTTFSQDPVESVTKGHQILALDAKRDLFQHLLNQMQEKHAIDPSILLEH